MKRGWFIGRFQPFHKGHQECIKRILRERDVCTVIVKGANQNDRNPYTLIEVKAMIDKWIKKEKLEKVVDAQIIAGDSEDLVLYYGRNVGWKFKEIKLSKKLENISATKIRGNVRP